VWRACQDNPSDSSHSYGRGSQRARFGLSGDPARAELFRGPHLQLNPQTADERAVQVRTGAARQAAGDAVFVGEVSGQTEYLDRRRQVVTAKRGSGLVSCAGPSKCKKQDLTSEVSSDHLIQRVNCVFSSRLA